ncbi:hypothetical protein HMPREF9370_0908 [Neisseria wadsworthii 9715]|uniref:Uncharacterized protein n=1 Tax=Neisseria wadsworthii 9715 TaxID=1030841 RepID=G4CP98_9NEIS|nr:hypothetical protein HMPREF9370_0908 [Neisseria wadsworthii 9715]
MCIALAQNSVAIFAKTIQKKQHGLGKGMQICTEFVVLLSISCKTLSFHDFVLRGFAAIYFVV